MSSKYIQRNNNIFTKTNKVEQHVKTTNVNILLNRVKQDKKKIFKKRILFVFLMILLISSLAIFLSI